MPEGQIMFEPIAVETVEFNKGITGEQLAALVQQIANRQRPHTQFIAVPMHYDGTVRCIGQAGNLRGVRVVPSLAEPSFIRPTTTYLWVKVTDFVWPEKDRPCSSTRFPQFEVRAVIEFAAELRTAYAAALTNGFPEYVDPEPIPWVREESA